MEVKKPIDKGMIIGTFLVGLGALLLLQTFGIINYMWDLTVGFAFLGGAAAFLAVFINDRRSWWTFFPAAALSAIGLMILADSVAPWFNLEGTLFLGFLGLAFVGVYVLQPTQVWPIIPGGALLTLATVAATDTILPFVDGGTVFFLGLAATFACVYFLAQNRPKYSWALIVAAVLGALGVLTAAITMMKYLFPIALIGVGVFLLRERLFPTNHNH